MQAKEMTCIACPMGCRMLVSQGENGEITVEGATCKRGITYAQQEFTCPMRTVTSSVRVHGGARPLCSVKTSEVVPKEKIPAVLQAIGDAYPDAPIAIGQVIVQGIAGTDANLIATSACAKG